MKRAAVAILVGLNAILAIVLAVQLALAGLGL